MTNIHKLHVELLPEYEKEWSDGSRQYQVRWQDPTLPMIPDIVDRIRKTDWILYHFDCELCSQIIHSFSQLNKLTISELEGNIVDLEDQVKRLKARLRMLERELKDRPVVNHTQIICAGAVESIFKNEN